MIEHKNYVSLYKDISLDPMGMNDDPAKVERLAKYLHPWRTKDGAFSKDELKQIVSDQFADHNIWGIGVRVTQSASTRVLIVFVGLKNYTYKPSSLSSKLFGHHYEYVGDVNEDNGEINKFDWDCLKMTSEVDVFKEKHHKTKLEDNPDLIIIPSVKEDDAQVETISVRHAMYILYCLIPLVLDMISIQDRLSCCCMLPLMPPIWLAVKAYLIFVGWRGPLPRPVIRYHRR